MNFTSKLFVSGEISFDPQRSGLADTPGWQRSFTTARDTPDISVWNTVLSPELMDLGVALKFTFGLTGGTFALAIGGIINPAAKASKRKLKKTILCFR